MPATTMVTAVHVLLERPALQPGLKAIHQAAADLAAATGDLLFTNMPVSCCLLTKSYTAVCALGRTISQR